MRILYNSKDARFKSPFGTLCENEECRISVYIPISCKTKSVSLVLLFENGDEDGRIEMSLSGEADDYEIYSCTFSFEKADLYFYYFRIVTENESFSLYREGYDGTNMESGTLWQISCVPRGFCVPEEYFGAVMYQIFPDRFARLGICNTEGKLEPFYLHKDMSDLPEYLPNGDGKLLNCDFYGGNLRGICEKLGYFSELGVKVIYLNPIFKAYSNHRYDTADYHKIDELLGDEEDFVRLCDRAHDMGMKIILDGVFSHTGSNSKYFDKLSVFGGGAYSNENSPYRSWYGFERYPDVYTSWWGIDTLPCVNELDEGFLDYIIRSEDSVIAHWVKCGADGFRLDVADELPDEFIYELRTRLKKLKKDSLLIGEVWEDASNKISYGKRRRYFTGGELDSVMNYPFRNCIIDYVKGNDKGTQLCQGVMTIAENYPSDVLNSLMNILSTHDTERILSVLSPSPLPTDKDLWAGFKLNEEDREEAVLRLKVAAFLQFILPGMPCIYYGDEIGTEGGGDPFCRSFFDWGRVDNNELRDFYIKLAKLKNSSEALRFGDISVETDGNGRVTVTRKTDNEFLRAYVNMGEPITIKLESESIFFHRADIYLGEAVIDRLGVLAERCEPV